MLHPLKKLKKFLGNVMCILSFLSWYTPFAHAGYRENLPPLQDVGSEKWVLTKLETYPELRWLLAEDVQHTQEGQSTASEQSWSQKLIGMHHPEFERTILSMVCLYLIADGTEEAYTRFTMLQPDSEKLSKNSFKRLHQFADEVLSAHPDQLKALEINLLLGDLGKTQEARKHAARFNISEPDHDLFLDQCLTHCSQIFPTFPHLSNDTQKKIREVTGLVHFGHLTHVEGGPEMLTKLKQSGILKEDPKGFDFETLTHICDVSAARGQEDNRGSKVMTENVFRALEAVKDMFHVLSAHTETDALKHYLKTRAEWLGFIGKDEELLLARLGSEMRLFFPEEGKALKLAYEDLPQEQKKLLHQELDPFTVRKDRTPTYVPAFLVNFLSTCSKQGLSKEESVGRCMREGVTFIGHVLHQYRQGHANQPYNPELTLNFNKAAGQARENTTLLKSATFAINPEGSVEIKSMI